MTRHLELSNAELWQIGRAIGEVSQRTLRARADLKAAVFFLKKLRVVAAPMVANPNHANAVDWPLDKPSQKNLAREIAEVAGKALPAPAA
jgi:hypothetical protein